MLKLQIFPMQQNCNDIFMTRKKELQIFKNLPTTKKNLTDTMFTETNGVYINCTITRLHLNIHLT